MRNDPKPPHRFHEIFNFSLTSRFLPNSVVSMLMPYHWFTFVWFLITKVPFWFIASGSWSQPLPPLLLQYPTWPFLLFLPPFMTQKHIEVLNFFIAIHFLWVFEDFESVIGSLRGKEPSSPSLSLTMSFLDHLCPSLSVFSLKPT